jgi:hypothetical protein
VPSSLRWLAACLSCMHLSSGLTVQRSVRSASLVHCGSKGAKFVLIVLVSYLVLSSAALLATLGLVHLIVCKLDCRFQLLTAAVHGHFHPALDGSVRSCWDRRMVYEYDGIPVETFGYPFEQYLAQEILRRKHHDD